MSVPCGSCRLCCQGDAVRILTHENSSQWQTEPHAYDPRERMLAHKPNGDCIYLDCSGCSIHNQPRPQQCVEMDCRNIYRGISLETARILGARMIKIWRRGQELAREEE